MPADSCSLGSQAPIEVRSLVTLPLSFSEPMTAERTRLGSALAIRSSHSAALSRLRTSTSLGVSAQNNNKHALVGYSEGALNIRPPVVGSKAANKGTGY
eukprot:4376-Prorocentrum_minimum.AAC.3